MREFWDEYRTPILVIGAIVVVFFAVLILRPKPAKAEGILPVSKIAETSAAAVNWTGLYIGVGGGYQMGNLGTSLNWGDINLVSSDGLSMHGWGADARIGFDWQIGNSPFVIGVLGGYNVGEAEYSASVLEGIGKLRISLEPTWYIGGRAGLVVAKSSLVYVGYAYQSAEGELVISIFDDVGRGTDTLNAHVLLAGIETALTPQLTLGAEYSFAKYEDVKTDFGGGLIANFEPEVHAFKARLNWRPFAK